MLNLFSLARTLKLFQDYFHRNYSLFLQHWYYLAWTFCCFRNICSFEIISEPKIFIFDKRQARRWWTWNQPVWLQYLWKTKHATVIVYLIDARARYKHPSITMASSCSYLNHLWQFFLGTIVFRTTKSEKTYLDYILLWYNSERTRNWLFSEFFYLDDFQNT